ncbi:leucine-rich repeat domain-containing protein [Prevotella sp. P6B4]|uniref:leucine-rich repeat domain-containing protein n=1 Tax=Prevotella sp. P6B4 TaxID=1410614 RepID=UPI000A9F3503|nr:leucine-rich repeat domain-containing protein [Prevotella sp. P6B4]
MTFICVDKGDGAAQPHTAILSKSKTSTEDVVIPTSVTLDDVSYAVTEIDKSAFSSSSNLKNITIPEYVESIGKEAFASCTGLTNISCKVSDPAQMFIGDNAFPEMSMALYVPYSVYDKYEFDYPHNWTRFKMHKGLRKETKNPDNGLTYEYAEDEHYATLIKAEVLKTTVEIDAQVDGKNVTTIAKDAFSSAYSASNKNITKLIIPDLVEFIKEDAFSSCTELEELWLPKTLTEIGTGAFVNSKKIKTIHSDLIVVNDMLPELKENVFPASFDTKIEIFIPEGTKEKYQTQTGWSAYADCYIQGERKNAPAEGEYNTLTFDFLTGEYTATLTNVTELKVDEEGLFVIPDQVYYNSKPYTIEAIGSNVFKNVDKSKIKKLKLQNGVKTINENAFEGLSALQKVWLPASLTSIGEKAFTGCTNITHICSDVASPLPVNENVFSLNVNNTATLFVPVGEKMNYTGGWISKIANIVEGEYETDIPGDMTFACYKVKNEPVEGQPETYTHSAILTKAATSITEALIKETVTDQDETYTVLSIGKNAFQNCKNLAKLELPSSLIGIGDNAFAGCGAIKEIVSDIEGKDLFKISENVFDAQTYIAAQVNIPAKSIEVYKTQNEEQYGAWYKFGKYEEGKWEEVIKDYGYSLRFRYHTVQKTIAKVIEIISPSKNPNKLIIPNTFKLDEADEDSYSVTEIALTSDTHFDRAAVDTLYISDGIKTIAAGAFKDCTNLSELKLPSKLETIGANAFQNCENLQKIWLPASLKTIGSKAFNGCKLTRVCTETTLTINKDVFSQYSAFLFVPTGTSVKGVTGWGDFARVYDGYYMGETTPNNDKTYIYLKQKNNDRTAVLLASKTSEPIPNYITFDNVRYKVTIIGESAFSGKGLNLEDWRELPESIVKIEKNAFKNTGLKEFKLPSNLTTIGDGAFSGNRNLTVLTLSDKLKTIGDDAFNGCSALKQIALPQTLTSIGARAFAGNTNLEELVLPNGLNEIKEKAFQNCRALTQMELPASLTTIGDNIFDGCSNLTAVISKVKNDVVSSSTQSVAQAILYVPEGYRSYYGGWTFSHIVEGDRKLGNANGLYYAYSTGGEKKKAILIDVDTELTGGDIDIPSTITLDGIECEVVAIERDVFVEKTDIKSVVIGENVTTIGANAFKGCTNLRKLELPSTLKSIGEKAFDGCDNIAEVVSHNRDNDFIQNNKLSLPNATVYVPENTQDLYEQAGWECAHIYAGSRVELEWQGLRFACLTEVQEAILVDATDTTALAKAWADGEILIPDSVSMGEDDALKYYHVVAIASKAFSGNTEVKLVELPATLTGIDPTAFEGCTNLAEVVSKIDSTEIINSIALSLPDAILYVSDRAKYVDTEWKFAQIFVGERVKAEQNGMSFICATGDQTAVLIKGSADQLGNDLTIPGAITIKIGEDKDAKDLECKVTAIAANAFQGCSNLNQIWLPATLKNIGEKAFDGCNAIAYICSTGDTPLSINKNVFSAYTATLYVPDGALSRYEQNDVWKLFPVRREGYFEGATTQNGLAFDCLTVGEEEKVAILTKAENEAIIEIPATILLEGDTTVYQMRTICQNAFKNSKKLEKIIFPETLRMIEEKAFEQCTKLTVITSRVKKEDLFTFNKNVFPEAIYSTAMVYVPYDKDGLTLAEYRNKWNYFSQNNWAQGEKKTGTVGGMTYDYLVGVGTATLTGSSVNTAEVTIDGTVKIDGETYIVTTIAESAFKNNPNKAKMTKLKIAENITTIGANAFQGCSNLKMVWLPAKLSSIAAKAFDGCNNITHVSSSIENPVANDADRFPQTATLFVPKGKKTNYNKSGWNNFAYVAEGELVDVCTVADVTYDCFKIDNQKKAILRKYAASSNDVVIPASVSLGSDAYTVAIIGKSAFAGKTAITSLVIPAGVETIDAGVFSACSKLVWIQSKIENPIDILNKNVFAINTPILFIPSAKAEAYRAKGWNFLNIYVGEKKEQTIDGWTYIYSTGDKKAILTKAGSVGKSLTVSGTFKIGKGEYTVTAIAESVFKGKTSIEELTISENIENIGAKAFQNCSNLEKVEFPSTLKLIGDEAFDGCTHLVSVTCKSLTPAVIGSDAFPSPDITINVPKDVVTTYKNDTAWGEFTTILGIIASISDETDDGNIADYVDTTPDGGDAEHTMAIIDGSDVKGEFNIPEKVEMNGEDYTVTKIAASTFEDNTDLTDITIPSTIESIGESAFAGCTNLKSITVYWDEPLDLSSAAARDMLTRTVGSSIFEGVDKSTCVLYVPAGCVEKYRNAPVWGDFHNILPIGTTAINGIVISEGTPFDVYDMQGRKVKSKVTTLKGLPSGVYIVNGKKFMVK